MSGCPVNYSNYPPGVTDNDPYFNDTEVEAPDDEEIEGVPCFKCGDREPILNGLCAMCCELYPQYM